MKLFTTPKYELIVRSRRPGGLGTAMLMEGLNSEEYRARVAAEECQQRDNALAWLARIEAWYVAMERMNPHMKAQYAAMLKASKHARWSVRFGRPDWRTELAQIRVRYGGAPLDLQHETVIGLKNTGARRKALDTRADKRDKRYKDIRAFVQTLEANRPDLNVTGRVSETRDHFKLEGESIGESTIWRALKSAPK